MTTLGILALALVHAGHPQFETGAKKADAAPPLPYETDADRMPKTVTNGDVIIRHGKVLTVTQGTLEDTDVLILKGKIAQIGKGLSAPAGITVINATGKIVTPGIVDAHSHRGATTINEGSDSITAEVQIRDVLNPDSIGLWFDLANGITSGLLLHGSANAIGGQSIVVKHKYKKLPSDMVFQGAPRMVKFALGENVTQKNSPNSSRFPSSRMGVEEVYRRGFNDAKAYMALWDAYNASVQKIGVTATLKALGAPPRKDVRLEALADILRRKIWVNCHSYRQDELLMMVRISQEFGFKLGTLQHALEAYKIAPELKAAGIPVSMFSDAWNYKMEVQDSIPMGAALCIRAGVLTTVNTDTETGNTLLTVDAGKLMRYGVDEANALNAVTINAAKELGVDQHVGSLEVGKDGDVAIWSGHPLSIYSHCVETLIDGEVVFERQDKFGVDKISTSKNTVTPNPLRSDLLKDIPKAAAYAIVGGTVHTVSGPVIPNGTVIVVGDKITAVGNAHTPIPKGAVRVEASGLHVYPGLIDAGSDLGLMEIGEVKQATDASEIGTFNPDLHSLIAINPESLKIPIARAAGVTTAKVDPAGGLFPGQTSVIDLGGYTREEMTLDSSYLVVDWPDGGGRRGGGFGGFGGGSDTASNPQIDAIKEQFLTAKRASEAGDLSDTKLAALAPYALGERPVLFKVESQRGIKAVLAFAKDLGLKAVIQGGADAWKVAKELATAKVPVIYTPPSVSGPGEASPRSAYDPYDTPYAAVSVLVNAGVKVAFASGDSGLIQDLPNRAGRLCAFGLTPDQAMKALTLDAAEILGVGKKIGSIESGKIANLIITDGDPLELTGQVLREFVGGKPQHLESHFTQLYRKYEARIKDSQAAAVK